MMIHNKNNKNVSRADKKQQSTNKKTPSECKLEMKFFLLNSETILVCFGVNAVEILRKLSALFTKLNFKGDRKLKTFDIIVLQKSSTN